MPEEQDNKIERRETGGINRRSEAARRGSDAARFVGGLANRTQGHSSPSTVSTAQTYEYSFEWGTEGAGDGEFRWIRDIALAPDGSVYVSDSPNTETEREEGYQRSDRVSHVHNRVAMRGCSSLFFLYLELLLLIFCVVFKSVRNK